MSFGAPISILITIIHTHHQWVVLDRIVPVTIQQLWELRPEGSRAESRRGREERRSLPASSLEREEKWILNWKTISVGGGDDKKLSSWILELRISVFILKTNKDRELTRSSPSRRKLTAVVSRAPVNKYHTSTYLSYGSQKSETKLLGGAVSSCGLWGKICARLSPCFVDGILHICMSVSRFLLLSFLPHDLCKEPLSKKDLTLIDQRWGLQHTDLGGIKYNV